MIDQLQQILALVMPQGAQRRVRYCGIQMVCLVMIWFFIQGSGGVVLIDSFLDLNPDVLVYLRLLNLGSQCVGGIIGSVIVLAEPRFARKRLRRTTGRMLPGRSPFVLACTALLGISLVAGFVCSVVGVSLASALFRVISCTMVTVLFLKACLELVGFSLKTTLAVFLLISLCRIVQNIIMLPFALDVAWAALSVVVELALLGMYGFTVVRLPRVAEPEEVDGAVEQTQSCTPAPARAETTADSASVEGTTPLGQNEARSRRLLPWQFIVHVMLYYFVAGILRLWEGNLAAPGLQINCAYLLASTASFMLYYFSFVRTGNTSDYWARIRQIAFPLMVGACAMTGLLSPAILFLVVICGQTAYRFFLLSSYVEMFSICDITDVNARHVFSVTHIVMYVGMFFGGFLGLMTQEGVVGNPSTVLAMTLLVFLCLTAASCWMGNDKLAGKVWGRRIELTPKGRQDELLGTTCRAIAEAYRLTAKEEEILEHLVRKESLDQIAASLVVSKNTVRTHVRNLYTKVGAHSQSDVYRLFDKTKTEVKR